jgi:hypothetical protein
VQCLLHGRFMPVGQLVDRHVGQRRSTWRAMAAWMARRPTPRRAPASSRCGPTEDLQRGGGDEARDLAPPSRTSRRPKKTAADQAVKRSRTRSRTRPTWPVTGCHTASLPQ